MNATATKVLTALAITGAALALTGCSSTASAPQGGHTIEYMCKGQVEQLPCAIAPVIGGWTSTDVQVIIVK